VGDAWQNNVGQGEREQKGMPGRGGIRTAACIESAPSKAKGACDFYNRLIDPIGHTIECDFKYETKAAGRKYCRPANETRGFSFEPYCAATDPMPASKIEGLPNRVFMDTKGAKRLSITGAEDLDVRRKPLSQDLHPSRRHVQDNDKKLLAYSQYAAMWDQIDGEAPVTKPNFNQSKKMWNLLDRRQADEQTFERAQSKGDKSRRRLKERARARSAEGRPAGTTLGINGMHPWEARDIELAKLVGTIDTSQCFQRPWADYEDSVVSSDTVSQVTSVPILPSHSYARGSRSIHASQRRSTTGLQMVDVLQPMNYQQAAASDRGSRSEVGPSDSISQVSVPDSRRSQSARGSRTSRDYQRSSRRDVAQQDSQVSQRSVPMLQLSKAREPRDNTMRRSQSARNPGQSSPRRSRGSQQGSEASLQRDKRSLRLR